MFPEPGNTRESKEEAIDVVIQRLQGKFPAQMVVDRLEEKTLDKTRRLQVAEKSRTGPVDGKRPTLGSGGSCDGESADTEERVQEKE